MSADDFSFVTSHPRGGFAVLMGFDSFDEPLIASESSRQFASFAEAMIQANSEDSEYGVRVDPRVLETLS
jgi:hypothetical protein